MSEVVTLEGQLAMSQGAIANTTIESILLSNIPGALTIHPAHSTNDRNGTDFWVEHASGKHLSVDAKVRKDDFALRGEDDLALETWSVVDKKIGWTRDDKKRTDYVCWFWVETGRWCLLPFPMLCRVFSEKWPEWSTKFKTRRQETKWGDGSYKSECVFVPRRTVWEAIYLKFSGIPPKPATVSQSVSQPRHSPENTASARADNHPY